MLLGLGLGYKKSNDFQNTVQYYQRASTVAKEHMYKQQETAAQLGLALSYREHDLLRQAIEYYEKAFEISNEHGYKK